MIIGHIELSFIFKRVKTFSSTGKIKNVLLKRCSTESGSFPVDSIEGYKSSWYR